MLGSVRLPIYPVYTLLHFTSEHSNLLDTQLTRMVNTRNSFPTKNKSSVTVFLHLLLNATTGLSDM
jgi:hypothetical protein